MFGHLAPLIKIRLPNCRVQQNLKNLDNLNTYCSNILSLYFPSESKGGQPTTTIKCLRRTKCASCYSSVSRIREVFDSYWVLFVSVLCTEGVSRPVSSTQQGSDFDNEPYKRRKQLLSVLVAVAAMLSYALLTGIVAIEHMHEDEPIGPASLRGPSHEDEEEE